MISAIYVKLI